MTLALGGTYDWGSTIEVLPANATNKNVTFASSDPTVATVDEDGVVTSVGAAMGACWITATTEDGDFEAKILIGCDQAGEHVYFSLTKADEYTGEYSFYLPDGAEFYAKPPGLSWQPVTNLGPGDPFAVGAIEGETFFALYSQVESLSTAVPNMAKGEFLFNSTITYFELMVDNQLFSKITTNAPYFTAIDCIGLTEIDYRTIYSQAPYIDLQGCSLEADQIEKLLAFNKANNLESGGSIVLEQGSGNNAAYSEWSAQAKADVADLILNGWTITYTA